MKRWRFGLFQLPPMFPEGEDLDEAVGMIASAKRPIILAGAGAVGARDQLIRLADRLEAPLTTALGGQGICVQSDDELEAAIRCN